MHNFSKLYLDKKAVIQSGSKKFLDKRISMDLLLNVLLEKMYTYL